MSRSATRIGDRASAGERVQVAADTLDLASFVADVIIKVVMALFVPARNWESAFARAWVSASSDQSRA